MIAIKRTRRERPTSDLCDIISKAWKKGENTENEASPTNPMSFLQTKFWMKRAAKKEKQRKGEHQQEKERKTEKEKGKDQKSSKKKFVEQAGKEERRGKIKENQGVE